MNAFVLQINGKDYRLKLPTRMIVTLEDRIGANPLAIFGNDSIPKVKDLMLIFHAALQPYNHSISLTDAYDLFDAYLEEGHTLPDFVTVIMEIFRASGLIAPVTEEEEVKN